jgi:hypothetical protein
MTLRASCGHATVSALIVALGIAIAGACIGRGLVALRTADRYVTVKGLAERYVDADLVVWPVTHAAAGNDLAEVQALLDAGSNRIRDFLRAAGFSEDELALSPPRITDNEAYSYSENAPRNRFRAEATVTLRTDKVAAAIGAMQRAGELVRSGVLLTFGYGPEGMAQFQFTKLNDVKPELIAEATKNARAAAEQFAKDSSSRVGGIRAASQGQIDIRDRDQSSPQVKKIRVVTTVEYRLED